MGGKVESFCEMFGYRLCFAKSAVKGFGMDLVGHGIILHPDASDFKPHFSCTPAAVRDYVINGACGNDSLKIIFFFENMPKSVTILVCQNIVWCLFYRVLSLLC